MRFGMCSTDPAMVPVIKQSGYDFCEGSLIALRKMSDEQLEELRRALEENDLPMEGTNCFVSSKVEQMMAWTPEYADSLFENAIKRVLPLGVKYMVIGSGKARSFSEDMTYDQAYEKFSDMLRRYGAIAEHYGVDIVIEPLCKQESNLINYVTEAADLCRDVNHPRVCCLADFYHLAKLDEPYSHIADCKEYVRHIHLRNTAAQLPLAADEAEMREMAAALKAAGYDGRCSMEGGSDIDLATAIKEASRFFPLFR